MTGTMSLTTYGAYTQNHLYQHQFIYLNRQENKKKNIYILTRHKRTLKIICVIIIYNKNELDLFVTIQIYNMKEVLIKIKHAKFYLILYSVKEY